MSAQHILSSLDVENYRAIRRLRIPELGQVNLFVGKNNVGKTSLLEAVRLYVSPNPRVTIFEIIRERTGLRSAAFSDPRRRGEIESEQIEAAFRSVEALFHGSFTEQDLRSIRISPGGPSDSALLIAPAWHTGPDLFGERVEPELFLGPDTPLLLIERAGEKSELSLARLLRTVGIMRPDGRTTGFIIPPGGFEGFRVGRAWDHVAASGNAEQVEEVLRTIVRNLERVYSLGETAAGGRSVALKLRGIPRPVPLRSMGDGANRVFGIALALVEARDGVLLIDEIENGLHYTVQEQVWNSVLSLADKLGVQVFATTHSWDCIKAFAAASVANQHVDGMMHRLEEREGELRAVEFTEKELAIVTRQRIEVR